MLNLLMGNIREHVSSMNLRNQWQLKKENVALMMKNMREQEKTVLDRLREEEKHIKMAGIRTRLDAGRKLTPEELEYLRSHDPALYAKAKAISEERERYRAALRNCKTKEDAQRLHQSKTAVLFSQKDMESTTAHAAAILDEYMEFLKSGEYSRLPREGSKKRVKLARQPRMEFQRRAQRLKFPDKDNDWAKIRTALQKRGMDKHSAEHCSSPEKSARADAVGVITSVIAYTKDARYARRQDSAANFSKNA